MDRKLYKMMEWAEIEALAYAEEDRPHEFLGGHYVKDGILIQAFFPETYKLGKKIKEEEAVSDKAEDGAQKARKKSSQTGTGKGKSSSARRVTAVVQIARSIREYDMELMDEAGFYAVLIRTEKKPKFHYCFKIYDGNGEAEEIYDPYSFSSTVSDEDIEKFSNGVHYGTYKFLGAHLREIDGIKGTSFAVWAPNALRASVIGDFNSWDGRTHQMRRLSESGIFELFIPGVEAGAEYKYELRLKGQRIVIKKDPYALRDHGGVSVVCAEAYEFNDSKWINERKKFSNNSPLSIYELSLDCFKTEKTGDGSLKELAVEIADHVKGMGYTHVELWPVMEHEGGTENLYEPSCFYAPSSALGKPDDLKYFIDHMHSEGIGVILDWVPSYFTKEEEGLREFDGTCLYGHLDIRQRYNGKRGTLVFNFARPQVSSFLISNAFFWLDEYHADGLRIDSLDEMIYLDYGKRTGDWLPNKYGGKESIEAEDFLKQLNMAKEERKDGTVTIAEGLKTWGKVTAPVKEGGLGFDYKWDKGFAADVMDYLSFDPFFRTHHYGELIYSFSYFSAENFILPFSFKDMEGEDGTAGMFLRMPGGRTSKYANLRAAYGLIASRPGKFMSFMGFDAGRDKSFDGYTPFDPRPSDNSEEQSFSRYIKELLHFYREHPALYKYDSEEKGFEWINNTSANENILVFQRSCEEEKLLVVLNFANVLFSDLKIGVPEGGKYKEIFNSDAAKYGGGGNVNPRIKASKKEVCDGFANSIKIKAAPLGFSVFLCYN